MKYKMKYQFRAVFSDGTTYEQNEADTSKIDGRRSGYFDVLAHGLDKVVEFYLVGEGMWWSVNLIDGKFRCNGEVFGQSDPALIPTGKKTLIYFRRVQQSIGQHEIGQGGSGNIYVQYHFGWECVNPDGRKWKRIHWIH